MHSLGNDFMVVDGVSRSFEPNPESIRRWGCRHTGIGFDQLLIIAPPESPDVDFDFQIYNADGSQAEQCGNGTRCVAMLAKSLGLTKKDRLVWHSLAGRFETEMNNGLIRTTMTVPELTPQRIPFDPDYARATDHPNVFELDTGADGIEFTDGVIDAVAVTPVSMGNPHAVIFVDDLFNLDVDAAGRQLTDHPAFPERANVEFCQIVDPQFARLRVYERGVGETQACGSGACAAVVAAELLGHTNGRVKISLPGGKLRIHWPGPDTPVYMSGPATLIYEGEVSIR